MVGPQGKFLNSKYFRMAISTLLFITGTAIRRDKIFTTSPQPMGAPLKQDQAANRMELKANSVHFIFS